MKSNFRFHECEKVDMEGASAGAVNDIDCFCYNLKHKIEDSM